MTAKIKQHTVSSTVIKNTVGIKDLKYFIFLFYLLLSGKITALYGVPIILKSLFILVAAELIIHSPLQNIGQVLLLNP